PPASAAARTPRHHVAIALALAATQLFDAARGTYAVGDEQAGMSADELIDLVERWCARFPVVSVEDALAEDDWDGWQRLTTRLGGRLQLVGDDLFTTSVDRLDRGVRSGVANAILIKLNQVGTITAATGAGLRAERG